MRKEESKLWSRVKGHMQPYGHIRLERVEATINDGIPDIHAIARNADRRGPYNYTSWVELKQVPMTHPARIVLGETHQKLSVDQKNWHMDYGKYGGRVATLIGMGSYVYALVQGCDSETVNTWNGAQLEGGAIIIGSAELFFPHFAEWLNGVHYPR